MARDTDESPSGPTLTTGQAAKLFAVTPDTVLKWVKSGRLPARRTAGGHYRIARADVESLRTAAAVPPVPLVSPPEHDPVRATRQFQYCWEYYAQGETIRDDCRECVVYRTRAQRCYEFSKGEGIPGHRRAFCKGVCDTCDYYLKVQGEKTNLLMVSNNALLTSLVKRAGEDARFNFEATSCEYTASALVDHFRPDFVLVDCSLGSERTKDICAHLLEDPRIPLARIILAASQDELPAECDHGVFAIIDKPFTVKDLIDCLADARRGSKDEQDVGAASTG